MSFKEGFAEILEKKMGSTLSEPKISVNSQPQRAPSLDWILPIFAPRKVWTPHKIPAAYPRIVGNKQPNSPKISLKNSPSNTSEEVFQTAQLSEKGKKALKILVRLGAELANDQAFRASELKTQYRRLARIYHPDSQHEKASSKHFNMCSICYKIVSKEVSAK